MFFAVAFSSFREIPFFATADVVVAVAEAVAVAICLLIGCCCICSCLYGCMRVYVYLHEFGLVWGFFWFSNTRRLWHSQFMCVSVAMVSLVTRMIFDCLCVCVWTIFMLLTTNAQSIKTQSFSLSPNYFVFFDRKNCNIDNLGCFG